MKRSSDEGAKPSSSRPGKAAKTAGTRPGKKASSKKRSVDDRGTIGRGAPKGEKDRGESAGGPGRKKQRNIVVPDTVIGRVERVDLPAWDVSGIKAKVDTGARTSSIHVEEIRVLTRNRLRARR